MKHDVSYFVDTIIIQTSVDFEYKLLDLVVHIIMTSSLCVCICDETAFGLLFSVISSHSSM